MRRTSRPDRPKPAAYSAGGAGRIWEEDLGRRLLDDRAADADCRARRWRFAWHRHMAAFELAPGFRAVLGEMLEGRVRQQPPELIHPAHQPPAVEELAHQVKQVQRDGSARSRVVQEIRDIEAEDRMVLVSSGDDRSSGIVEDPRVVALGSLRTTGRSRRRRPRVGRVQELDEARQAPRASRAPACRAAHDRDRRPRARCAAAAAGTGRGASP